MKRRWAVRDLSTAVAAGWFLLIALAGCSSGGDTTPSVSGPDGCVGPGCYGTLDTLMPAADTPAPPADAALPGDDAAVSGPDSALTPPCTADTDCPDGFMCRAGTCFRAQTCAELGTCPPPSEGELRTDPDENLWFSYFPGRGEVVTRTLLVANAGRGLLTVDTFDFPPGNSPDFTLAERVATPFWLEPGAMREIDVVFTEVTGTVTPGVLLIRSDDPVRPELRLNLVPQPKGEVAADSPCLTVDPVRLNFNAIQRGRTGTLVFRMTTCSPKPVQIYEIKKGSGLFGLPMEDFELGTPVMAPRLIQPGETVMQTVIFTAGVAGPKSGHFIVRSDDPSSPETRVNVLGTALAPPMESQGLHVELRWDSDNSDVDLHLLAPGGTFSDCGLDCHFQNMSPDWGVTGDFVDDAFLDVDNVRGFGPENINVQAPAPGVYKVIIHYYRDSYDSSGSTDTRATVRLFHYGTLLQEFGPTRLENTGKMWDVCTVEWPSLTVTPLGQVYDLSGGMQSCLGW